jgi:hypothetical protein
MLKIPIYAIFMRCRKPSRDRQVGVPGCAPHHEINAYKNQQLTNLTDNKIIQFVIINNRHNKIIVGQERTHMSSRRFFNDKKKPSKATTDNTNNMVDDAFIHNPKDRQRATKFERKFGVRYAEGTKTDYPLEIAPIYKLAIHHIPHPYGVMSTTPIPTGGTLAEYTGELMSGEPDDMSYIYRVGKQFIDGREVGSIGRFFNHSDNNNCDFVTESGKVLVKTLRDIAPGEQLTVNYGHKYFTTDINRVYIDAHHTSLSFQQTFLQHQADYIPLSKLNDAKLKKTITQLMNCTDVNRILVPRIEQPNYPILLLNNNQISDDQAEITLFQALCTQQNNDKLIFTAIKNGADINIQDSNGRNALFYLISNPNIPDDEKAATLNQILRETENHQGTPFVTDRNFKTIFHYCIENHLNDCLAVLLRSVNFNIEYFDLVVESPIHTAINNQNIEALTLLLAKYSYINMQNHMASEKGHETLASCIARITDEEARNNIYAIFSDFVNVGQLAIQVQEQLSLQTPNSPISTVSSPSSPSSDDENKAERMPSKRERKPNLHYPASDFITKSANKSVSPKRMYEETPKPDVNSHTVFSRKKQKYTETETHQKQNQEATPISKNTRRTRSKD